MIQTALILPPEIPLKYRQLCVNSPALGESPRWNDPMQTARDALKEAGIAFDELREDASLAQLLQFPRYKVAMHPFVDQLMPGSFEVFETFVKNGGKVIGQCCYAGEYCWWADSGFSFNCYLFVNDYRGPLLANIVDYLTTGRILQPPSVPLTAPRSMKLGFWQPPSLPEKKHLEAWDLHADTYVFWVARMEQPAEKVEAQLVRILDRVAERGCRIWLGTHADHPTSQGYSSHFWHGRPQWVFSPAFTSRLKPRTQEALQGFMVGESGTAQILKLAYFREASDMRDAEQRYISGVGEIFQHFRQNGIKKIGVYEHSTNHHQNYEAGADVSEVELLCGSEVPMGLQCAAARGMARAYRKPFFVGISLWYGPYRIGQFGDSPETLWDALHTAHLFGADEVHLEADCIGTGLVCGSAPREGRPVTAEFEETLSNFSQWSRTVERRGVPLVSVGLLKGQYDGCSDQDFGKGVYGLAKPFHMERNNEGRWKAIYEEPRPQWQLGPAEWGWKIWDLFYPRTVPFDAKAVAARVSSTPYGLVEQVPISSDLSNLETYKLLILPGWNTMCSKTASHLIEYVRRGGILLLALPHLSSHVRREDALDGSYCFDISEVEGLVGFKIGGKSKKVTGPLQGEGDWGLNWNDISFSATSARLSLGEKTERLLTANNEVLFTANHLGKGICYCWTTWEYPGAPGVIEAFKIVCKKILDQYAAFHLRTTGKVAAAPYVDQEGKTWIHLVNHEPTSQKAMIRLYANSLEIEIPPRTHQVFAIDNDMQKIGKRNKVSP